MRRPAFSKTPTLAAAALAVVALGGTTVYHLLQPAPVPAAPVRELYSCHVPAHRVDKAPVCIGTDQGVGVEFVVTGPEDPRLTDNTHDVYWAPSSTATSCGQLVELVRPYLDVVVTALEARAADEDAPVRTQLEHASAAMGQTGVVIALGACRASGLNQGTVGTAMVNLLRGAYAIPAENAASTAQTLRGAPGLLAD
ncbi:hypothetical protein [Nonomuraea recticatena]|uniref:Uncharacterized protein n=1 Tax=Nonomuraea recticatena TaxID=46178 RepID=A0ABP6F7K7_9ACTN